MAITCKRLPALTLSSWWGEFYHQTENSLDLGWTAGATSKVSVLLRPQRLPLWSSCHSPAYLVTLVYPGAIRRFGSLHCRGAGLEQEISPLYCVVEEPWWGRLISSLMREDSRFSYIIILGTRF